MVLARAMMPADICLRADCDVRLSRPTIRGDYQLQRDRRTPPGLAAGRDGLDAGRPSLHRYRATITAA